jgi:hypothetical protein
MTHLCPNCSRPARKEAQFCGFCGTYLFAQVKPAVPTSVPNGKKNIPAKTKAKNLKLKKRDTGKTVALAAIFLMLLIISLAVIGQHWVEMLAYIGSSISILAAG